MSALKVMEFDKQTIAFRVALSFFGLCWLLVLFVRLRLPDAHQESSQGLVVLVVGAACWVGAWQSTLLARSWGVTARVLRARQVPGVLWRQSLHDSLKSASRLWAVLAVGMLSVLLPAHSPLHWLTALALLALVLMLALLARLAAGGLMPRFWFWVFPGTVVLVLSNPLLGVGLLQIAQFLNAIPWVLPLAVCLGVPALLLWLLQRWRSGPPQAMEVPLALNMSLLGKKVKAWFAQYVVVSRDFVAAKGTATKSNSSAFRALMGPMLSMSVGGFGFVQPLGSPLIFSHVLGIGMMTGWVCNYLVCKDLHWRYLLVPGGPHRGRLGLHIAFSTATLYLLWFSFFLVVGIAAGCVFSDHPLEFLQTTEIPFGTLPFELIFAISLGTLIRSTRYPGLWVCLLVVMWLLFLLTFFIEWGSSFWQFSRVSSITVDFPYLLGLLVLSALALWASNKLWTVERLLQCTPRST